MFFVEAIELEGLGNRSYLAGGRRTAVVVDPPRDIDRVLATAARRGVAITHVVETHIHNDYVTGGLELARITGAAYLVPAGAHVSFARTAVSDGDTVVIDAELVLAAVATPGHTPHHTAYVLSEAGRPSPRSPAVPSSSVRWGGPISWSRGSPSSWPAPSTPPPTASRTPAR